MSSRNRAALTAGRYLVLLLLLTIPAWAPLTRPGMPASQAGPAPVLRLYAKERGESVGSGMLPLSWRLAGPWPLLVARAARGLGADAVVAVKFSLGLALLALSLGVFAWARGLAGNQAGVLAALLSLYTPILLGAVYAAGQGHLAWVAAGVALAGAGGSARRNAWVWLLTALGAVMAVGTLPRLGIVAMAGMLILLIVMRRWGHSIVLLASTLLAFILFAPGGVGGANLFPEQVASLPQLIEPAWFWEQTTIKRGDWPLFSLGLALPALLLIGIWTFFARDAANRQTSSDAPLSPPFLFSTRWLFLLSLGLLFTLLSFFPLTAHFLEPWHFLIIALPFLAVAAAAVLQAAPGLSALPLWSACLVIVILSAGPTLSPAFETYAIPSTRPVIFGDNQVMLLDLNLSGSLESGAELALQAEWVTWQTPDFDYSIFIHVEDKAGNTVAQVDAQPQAGARPMTTWNPGEVISDQYQLAIPPDAPTDLQLKLGLYNWQTLERLPAGDQDALVLGRGALE